MCLLCPCVRIVTSSTMAWSSSSALTNLCIWYERAGEKNFLSIWYGNLLAHSLIPIEIYSFLSSHMNTCRVFVHFGYLYIFQLITCEKFQFFLLHYCPCFQVLTLQRFVVYYCINCIRLGDYVIVTFINEVVWVSYILKMDIRLDIKELTSYELVKHFWWK